MKIMVLFTAFDTIVGPEAVNRLRKDVAEACKRITASGKLESGGVFADRRGGYMILNNIESAEEINELFQGEFLDNFHIETHPFFTFERLMEFFAKHGVKE